MRHRLAALALAGALTLAPLAASAQTRIVVTPGPGEIPPAGAVLAPNDARAIADSQGIRAIDKLWFNRWDNQWEVDGRDYAGRWVTMDIDATTGAITDLER